MAKMTKNSNDFKSNQKFAKQATKDFAKLVKRFARETAKGNTSGAAFVVGFLDAATGNSSFSNIPESNVIDYSKGWRAGTSSKTSKRKAKTNKS